VRKPTNHEKIAHEAAPDLKSLKLTEKRIIKENMGIITGKGETLAGLM